MLIVISCGPLDPRVVTMKFAETNAASLRSRIRIRVQRRRAPAGT